MTYPSPEEIERERRQQRINELHRELAELDDDSRPPTWFKNLAIGIVTVGLALIAMIILGLLGLAFEHVWGALGS